ncbi:MAG: hypothetical protein ACHQ52_12330, partial [Candidatus Eisenbacteria bacterium]
MTRSPSGRLVPALVLLAALAGAAGASTGHVRGIYRPSDYGTLGRRGCILPDNVPRFDAIALHADMPAHAESLAARLGFAAIRGGGPAWRVSVPLTGAGAGLVWRDARHDPAFEAQGLFAPVPLQSREFLPPDPVLPLGYGRVPDSAQPAHPNSVVAIAYMIGLVADVERTADRWPPERTRESGGGVPLLDFRAHYPVPRLGAVASDAPGGGFDGRVRLLEPDGSAGYARDQFARHGAGWIGFGLLASDLARAAAWFDARGVRYSRDLVAGRAT